MSPEYSIDGDYFRSGEIEGSIASAFMQGGGFDGDQLGKAPIIGICNSWSELNPCNASLDKVAQSVSEGIIAAGGVPVEFPTISIHEQINNPSSLMLRNLMAMDVEEMITKSPIDGVVLLNGCDKTVPAQLMGAISGGKPMISISAGPRSVSTCGGKISTIHNLWGKKEERQKGEVSDEEWKEFTSKIIPDRGTCNVMGTASTMSGIVEALGFSLPGTAFLPAASEARLRAAEQTGRMAVEMTTEGRTPDTVVNDESLENAFRAVCALGGSSNAVIHLEAIAGRLGSRLGLDSFREWSSTTPHLVSVIPSGVHQLDEFSEAGGMPLVFKRLASSMNLDSRLVTGESWKDVIEKVSDTDSTVVRPKDNPVSDQGGLAILQGSLAPDGAVFKRSAVPKEFWTVNGPAVVFDGLADMENRINDPDLDVSGDSILVLRGMGPVGGPGMPEAAKIPIPKKLWDQGVRNMLRISDGRMSGTADGAVVLHVTPEAAVGGPLAFVRDGDIIDFDAEAGSLELQVDQAELEQRDQQFVKTRKPSRGYEWLYSNHVTQADRGADLDFLVHESLKSKLD